ncbi:UNKNOWN [Stylonychia lemnae]|uniref:Endonuclease/exonuclease/phosphatase domain-containing protein n=1 Tax=Stylonychia lemnae TaxID=5949 RepID=A0A077ZR88_STYLE|nr:UNKNOWN [Stylonychia lemnae]|eukprot:CDW71855.1 UNKNOWN [Stylonychia lemnae]
MINGKPELVKPDIQTDIPTDKLIHNIVQIDKVYREEKKMYLLDLYLQQLPENKAGSFKVVETVAFKVIDQAQWVRVSDIEKVYHKQGETVKYISFVTYNIWFESFYKRERYQVLLRMIEQSDSDFICLQEVIYEFQMMLFKEKFVQDKYFLSNSEIHGGYGVLIMSKWPCKFYEAKFPTNMGRSLLLCETIINDKPVIVSTAHFESLGNGPIRKQQLEISFPILSIVDDAFLMGDFNFNSTWKLEQANISKDFDDVFLTLNNGVESFTMQKTPRFSAWRPDKILAKKSSKWKAEFIQRIGLFCIPSFAGENVNDIETDQKVRTPSDHMGLFSIFKLNESEEKQ